MNIAPLMVCFNILDLHGDFHYVSISEQIFIRHRNGWPDFIGDHKQCTFDSMSQICMQIALRGKIIKHELNTFLKWTITWLALC